MRKVRCTDDLAIEVHTEDIGVLYSMFSPCIPYGVEVRLDKVGYTDTALIDIVLKTYLFKFSSFDWTGLKSQFDYNSRFEKQIRDIYTSILGNKTAA